MLVNKLVSIYKCITTIPFHWYTATKTISDNMYKKKQEWSLDQTQKYNMSLLI